MHFLYVFSLQFFVQLYMFRTTTSFIIRSSRLFALTVRTVRANSQTRLHGLYRAADTVNHELLMMNEMVVRNM